MPTTTIHLDSDWDLPEEQLADLVLDQAADLLADFPGATVRVADVYPDGGGWEPGTFAWGVVFDVTLPGRFCSDCGADVDGNDPHAPTCPTDEMGGPLDFDITDPLVWVERTDTEDLSCWQADGADGGLFDVTIIGDGADEGRWQATVFYGSGDHIDDRSLGLWDDLWAAQLACQSWHEYTIDQVERVARKRWGL